MCYLNRSWKYYRVFSTLQEPGELGLKQSLGSLDSCAVTTESPKLTLTLQ